MRRPIAGILTLAFLAATSHAQLKPLGAWAPAATASDICSRQSPDCIRVALPDGRTLVVADTDDGQPSVAQVFDPAKGTWQPQAGLAENWAGYTGTLLSDGRVLFAGGRTRSLEIFDPGTNGWTQPDGQLTVVRSFNAAALLDDGTVLITGGRDGDTVWNTADLFDPATGSVIPAAVLSVPRWNHTAIALLDGTVLIAGGEGQATAEVYDPAQRIFAPTGSMNAIRSSHAAIRLPDNNEVLIAGGRDAGGEALASAEIYDPISRSFLIAAPMLRRRAHPSVQAGSRGIVVVSGGDGPPETFHFPTLTATRSAGTSVKIKIDGADWQPGTAVGLNVTGRPFPVSVSSAGTFQEESSSEPAGRSDVTATAGAWQVRIVVHFGATISFETSICGSVYGTASDLTGLLTVTTPLAPTGTIMLQDYSQTLITQTNIPPPAPYQFIFAPILTAGTHSLTAVYSGDSHYPSATSSAFPCTVSKNPNVTNYISVSPNPSVYGQQIQLTDSLMYYNQDEGQMDPTGTVTFGWGPSIGVTAVQSSQAQLTAAPPIPVGNFEITAQYSGDNNFDSSYTSNTPFQSVTIASSTVSASSTPALPVYGQQVSVRFTASPVSPSVAVPQGSCTFITDNVTTNCGSLDSFGGATETFANGLPVGNHTLNMKYRGNNNMGGSTGSMTLTVNTGTAGITLGSSANPTNAGHSVTFTSSVSATAGVPTGSVAFSDGTTPLGKVSLTSGAAGITVPSLAKGVHNIYAVYSGDGNFTASQGSMVEVVYAACDLDTNGVLNVADIQRMVSEASGALQPVDDLNQDGRVGVVDIQLEIKAVLTGTCSF